MKTKHEELRDLIEPLANKQKSISQLQNFFSENNFCEESISKIKKYHSWNKYIFNLIIKKLEEYNKNNQNTESFEQYFLNFIQEQEETKNITKEKFETILEL